MTAEPGRADGEKRVDRRRARTRKALIGAGQQLFAAKSVDGVTIDDIVDAADVAKGSFYNHFEGKEGLAETIVALVQGDCEREVYAANADVTDASIRVARAVVTVIRYAIEHPDRYHAMVNLTRRRVNIHDPINDGVRHDIESGIHSGQFTKISVEAGVLAVFGLIATAVDHLSAPQGDDAAREIGRQIAFVMLRALGVPDDLAANTAEDAVTYVFG